MPAGAVAGVPDTNGDRLPDPRVSDGMFQGRQESRSGRRPWAPSVSRMNKLIRQVHRWLSMAFTVSVVVVTGAIVVAGEPAGWVYALPVVPALLLLISGWYLLAAPYLRRRAA